MEDKTVVACVGIAAVAAVETVNLLTRGPDSAIVSAVIGAVTAIVGYFFGKQTSS